STSSPTPSSSGCPCSGSGSGRTRSATAAAGVERRRTDTGIAATAVRSENGKTGESAYSRVSRLLSHFDYEAVGMFGGRGWPEAPASHFGDRPRGDPMFATDVPTYTIDLEAPEALRWAEVIAAERAAAARLLAEAAADLERVPELFRRAFA